MFKSLTKLKADNKWGAKFSGAIIKYMQRNYMYVVKGVWGEKGLSNVERCAKAIQGVRSLVMHMFGDHSECNAFRRINDAGVCIQWCGFNREGEGYKPHLPFGKFLVMDNRFEPLMTFMMEKYGSAKVIKKQLHGLTTNANESYHAMLVSIMSGGKSQQNGQAGAYHAFVCLTVCSKNMGHTYIEVLRERLGLPRLPATFEYFDHLQRRREKMSLAKNTRASKRKNRNKKEHLRGDNREEYYSKFGKNLYKSGMAHDLDGTEDFGDVPVVEKVIVSGSEKDESSDEETLGNDFRLGMTGKDWESILDIEET